MENIFRKVLFCDTEPVLRTLEGRYGFVIQIHCGELFSEVIVL